MRKSTLPRRTATGWVRPYPAGPFSPVLYADGGAGDGGGSGSDDGTGTDGGQDQGQKEGQNNADSGSGQGGSGDNGQGDTTDWKARAREWEKRAKENKAGVEQGRTAMAELEKLRKAKLTDQEKAIEEAEARGRTTAAQESQAEIEKRDAQIRELAVKDAVRERAEKHKAKATALLDSVAFRQKIADLDPADKTFVANLDDAIKAAVKDNPAVAAQTAGKSGADLSGGTGEGAAKKRSGSLAGAIANHYQT